MALERGSPIVSILVLGSGLDECLLPESDTCAALERMGPEVAIETRSRREDFSKDLEAEALDLIVLDCRGGDEAARWLETLGGLGPPVLAVLRDDDDESALRAFRAGAAQCLRVGPDYPNVLVAASLELIHRWQAAREQGRVERRIQWLESLSDAIVSQIPAALVVVDGTGDVVMVNPEGSRLFSIAPSRAIGNAFESICPPDLYRDGGLGEMIESARRDADVPARRARWARDDGPTRAFDVLSQKLDAEDRVLLVLSDVTATERQAERIDELQRYNANIIQNINSALLVVDPGQTVRFANPTAEHILGVESGKLIGRPLGDWFPEREGAAPLIVQTLEEGARFKGAETLVVRGDGRVIPIGISCSPLHDAPGRSLGAVAIFQDLSDIKQLERQVMQSEKMASIGQLAAGVAHEINNPVGFIHANLFQLSEYLRDLEGVWDGLAQLQERIQKGESLEEVREASAALRDVCREIDLDYVRGDITKAVSESQEGSERIRHIVRDLRGFSREDNGKTALADINECVESTANIVWTMMRHAVVLKRDYGELPRLRCHAMQIKQVLMNLLMNACQAIAEKGDSTNTPGMVEVRTEAREGGVLITICDNGVGISADNQARIFEPFFTTKDVGAGTGLGLSTSYGIVKRHGGEIEVSSEPGRGTTFEVWLPGQVGNRQHSAEDS
ncbi:MAG: PAS domain-containing protein [bacterium]|nr:PAS domain-containing protein [bacterium]